jgi:hypothetical protein
VNSDTVGTNSPLLPYIWGFAGYLWRGSVMKAFSNDSGPEVTKHGTTLSFIV